MTMMILMCLMRIVHRLSDVSEVMQQYRLLGDVELLNEENERMEVVTAVGELQYQLIMDSPKSSCKGYSCRIQKRHTESIKFQRDRRNYLEQALEDTCSTQNTDSRETRSNSSGIPNRSIEGPSEAKAGFITSLQPLMIQCSPSQAPRAPSLQECEVIIRQLYNANSLQSQEILRVKAVLKEIVFNKKITAENYILTKAYLADTKRTEDSETFPQLSLQTLPRGLPVSQASKAEKVILPALKQTLNNNVADRHRRTQAVQRRRLQRSIR